MTYTFFSVLIHYAWFTCIYIDLNEVFSISQIASSLAIPVFLTCINDLNPLLH